MAELFKRNAPVLDFGPKAPGGWKQRRHILWPAYAYRIVAPSSGYRTLNLFQRGVLGLCKAGLRDWGEIGKRLSIHAALVSFILKELVTLALVSEKGVPTEEGLRILSEDLHESYEMVAGYVFQNPWGGELWPRFVEHLEYCEVEYKENGFPGFVFSGQQKFAPYAVNSGTFFPPKPSPEQVIEAVTRHGKAFQYEYVGVEDEENSNSESLSTSSLELIERVSYIEQSPSPVYLMTYLFIPEDSTTSEWYVCDPFGLGVSRRFRNWIEKEMSNDDRLHKMVEEMIKSNVEKGLEDHKLWIDFLQKEAISEVEQRFPSGFNSQAIFDRVVQMDCAAKEVLYLNEQCPGHKIQSALRSCLKTIEALFVEIGKKYPMDDVWKLIYPGRDRKIVQAVYKQAALDVGFEEPFPDSMLTIKPTHIRYAAKSNQGWRCRALVVAIILAAWKDRYHPLRLAATKMPEMLRVIDEIANQGGIAGHANDKEFTPGDVESTLERTYEVITAVHIDNDTDTVPSFEEAYNV